MSRLAVDERVVPARGVRRARVGVVCDLLEERWPSMNLVADMLLEHLESSCVNSVDVTRIRPVLRRRFSNNEQYDGKGFTVDRLVARMWDYPRHLRAHVAGKHDVFHVIDHSYSHLVHALPPARTVVTCHDLDTFRCVLSPEVEQRPAAFRAMTRRILSGFRLAARVVCDSEATRAEIEAHGLIPSRRLCVVPLGVSPAFTAKPDPVHDATAAALVGEPRSPSPILLHVGSTIPRKRIEDLLHVFARVRAVRQDARLLRVGGPFTISQARLADALGVSASIVTLPPISSDVLSAVYRLASVVLQPSSAEGFGLPVVEAMACGTPVVASDIPALREIGGPCCDYATVGDTATWELLVHRLLNERERDSVASRSRKAAVAKHAARFTWTEYARKMVDVYEDVSKSQAPV